MSEHWKSLRNSFFAGLLVVLPVAASLLILISLFTWVTDFMLPSSLHAQILTPLYRVVALGFFVAVTIVVGWVARLVIGKRMIAVTEAIITHVPVLNKTYAFMKEISQTLLSGHQTMFQRVVLVELSRPGVYTVAFVTNEKAGEAQAKTKKDLVNVFFPASPPTHGYMILVPREQVIDLDMTVAEGMKLVISGGVVVPPYPPAALPVSPR